MIHLSAPARDAFADFDLAASRRIASAAATLSACRTRVLASYSSYKSDSSGGILAPATYTATEAQALRANFDLLDKSRPLEELRDEVLATSSPIHRKCPYCGVGRVAAIDHYLPKNHYPEFSILFLNLIPICARCNQRKLDRCRFSTGGSFFHSYLDPAIDDALLVATIDCSGPSIAVKYSVPTVSGIRGDLASTLREQCNILDLWDQFAMEAAAELMAQLEAIETFFSIGGEALVRSHLEQRLASTSKYLGKTSWLSALYAGLLASTDFAAGGFSQLRT